ncbi:hypothetical protein BJV78DRAFT_1159318, partial [Lactifluus subvellereus]
MARGRGAKRNVSSQRGRTGQPPGPPPQLTTAHSQDATLAPDEPEEAVNTDGVSELTGRHIGGSDIPTSLDVALVIDQHMPLPVGVDEDDDLILNDLSDENDPLGNMAGSSRSNIAFDIRHFFRRAPDKLSHTCKVCESIYNKDPAAWAAKDPHGKRRITFSGRSSNTTLRPHINSYHLLEYVTLVEKHGWLVYVQSVAQAKKKGYSISQIKQVIEADLDTSCCASIPIFSIANFQNALIDFVVADDQAINIIECIEFRRLLLMLHILHRTLFRRRAIQRWVEEHTATNKRLL